MKLSPSLENRLTLRAKNVIKTAENLASKEEMGANHLISAVLEVRGSLAYNILKNHGINASDFNMSLTSMVSSRDILKIALEEAMKHGYRHIGTEHLLWGLIREMKNRIVAAKHQSVIDVENHLKEIFYLSSRTNNPPSVIRNDLSTQAGLSSQAGQNILDKLIADVYKNMAEDEPTETPLEIFGSELTLMAKNGKFDPVIGREKEIERMITIMNRRTKNNPVLIGEPGVGKTALVYGLAQKIARQEIPSNLKDKKIFQIDLSAIVAGTTFRGEFEARLKDILYEAEEKNAVIFIDEFHTVVGSGAAMGSLDTSNIIKPLLSLGKVQIIGATTLIEWRKYVEKDSGLERRFQPIIISEPTENQTKNIIMGLLPTLEKHHNVKIGLEAADAAVKLSNQYIAERFLPDKAIDLIDEACALKTLDTNGVNTVLGVSDVTKSLSLITGIPEIIFFKSRKVFSKSEISSKLKKKIIGQDEAIEVLSNALRRTYAGLGNKERPLGSFLFVGPTGVGKTNLAKTLSQEILCAPLIKIDMSEFSEPHSIAKLIGAPPGYVGYEEPGALTEKIRREPHSVVLFDEIEKAHPQVASILLQILEDGTLTDSHGRKANFKNAVIILTSNIGSREFSREYKKFGFVTASKTLSEKFNEIKDASVKSLRRNFIPELLSRLDEIVVFKSLNRNEIKKIVDLEIRKHVINNLAEKKVEVKRAVADFIANKTVPQYNGAREIRNLITKLIINPLSDFILKNKTGKTILIDVKNNKINVK